MITMMMNKKCVWEGWLFKAGDFAGPMPCREAAELTLESKDYRWVQEFTVGWQLESPRLPHGFLERFKEGFVQTFDDMEILQREFSCNWGLACETIRNIESFSLDRLIVFMKGQNEYVDPKHDDDCVLPGTKDTREFLWHAKRCIKGGKFPVVTLFNLRPLLATNCQGRRWIPIKEKEPKCLKETI